MTTNYPVPAPGPDRKAFKDLLVEMTNSMRTIDDEREQMKDIAKAGEEKFGIKTKLIRKLASTMYKHNYQDWQEEASHFEHLYDTVIEGKT